MASINSITQLALINANNPGTINLPSASLGQLLTFKDSLGTFGTNNITLLCAGADTFEDGGTSKVLKQVRGNIQIVGSGTKWYVMSGTQVNTFNVSSITSAAISTNSISTNALYLSSLSLIDNNTSTNILNTSTFLKYNNYIIAGTRIGYNTLIGSSSFTSITTFNLINYPKQFSGLSLWLDANDSTTLFQDAAGSISVTNGSQVQLWKDKSTIINNASNGVQTNFIYNNTSLNNLPSVYFPGSGTGLALTGIKLPTGTTDCTMFFIMNVISPVAVTSIFYANGTTPGNNYGMRQFKLNSANIILGTSDSSMISMAYASIGKTIILGYISSNYPTTTSSAIYGYINGSINGTNTTPAGVGSSVGWLGSGGTDGTLSPYIGYISEVIMYSNVLSDINRQQVEGYLAWKWGLQSSLQTTHPFRYFPPG